MLDNIYTSLWQQCNILIKRDWHQLKGEIIESVKLKSMISQIFKMNPYFNPLNCWLCAEIEERIFHFLVSTIFIYPWSLPMANTVPNLSNSMLVGANYYSTSLPLIVAIHLIFLKSNILTTLSALLPAANIYPFSLKLRSSTPPFLKVWLNN